MFKINVLISDDITTCNKIEYVNYNTYLGGLCISDGIIACNNNTNNEKIIT